MQIDFHHAVTYVTARAAGFTAAEAEIIAYAAQYVDDAVSDGTICFHNKAMYSRICSAHKTIDPANLDDTKNHIVWLPFHFLPGNGGTDQKGMVGNHFIDKIVCWPGNKSSVAQDMLAAALAVRGKPNALHALGITMHVYADTWAHQGFAGVLHEINEVDHAEEIGHSGAFDNNLAGVLGSWLAEKVIPPLGHGRAQVFPDMPFLSWQYVNGQGKQITRNNTNFFCEAADAMCKFMQKYRGAAETGLPAQDAARVRTLFSETTDPDGGERHRAWLAAIRGGQFSFGKEDISYDENGRGSWKAKALGTAFDMPVYDYRDGFMESDWGKFHNALQQYRLMMLHEILPKYGICAG
ncbi:MAG: hypothetical protein M0017_01730 [Desulfobacteraceae bacterium]|nr:hypothetical protein [Desulfobacteraceae bacterium]